MLRTRNSIMFSSAKKEVSSKVGGYEKGNEEKGGAKGGDPIAAEWELRPGGMLVQKRDPDADQAMGRPPPTIRVRVKYGSTYHEIIISSQATFGELKKRLSGPTGLHHQDQKILYKDKEKDSGSFLDVCGVKDKSKLLLVEDPISHEKRMLEMRKTAKIEKASKSISEISLVVDKLAIQVAALETIIAKGKKVAEKDVLVLIESLMNELLKLDCIIADGDAKHQRKMQVRRVQKYVETLDLMKAKYSISSPQLNGANKPQQKSRKPPLPYTNKLAPIQEQPRNSSEKITKPPPPLVDLLSTEPCSPVKKQLEAEPQPTNPANATTVVTTLWETFDSAPAFSPASAPSKPTSNLNQQPQFPWDFYD